MFLTILGHFFAVLLLFVIGVMRGEQMESERAEKIVDSEKVFFTMKDGTKIFVNTKK